MTRFTIASFNVKNLIGPDKEYYRYQSYTPEEFNWKSGWLSEQIQTMDADIVGFQEIFEEPALRDVIAMADRDGTARTKHMFRDKTNLIGARRSSTRLAYRPYTDAALAFAPNVNDGPAGQRRPGLAILSRLGFCR